MMSSKDQGDLSIVPRGFESSEVLQIVQSGQVDAQYLRLLKSYSKFSDDSLSEFLHLNVKTFRNYRDAKNDLRKDLQEHVIVLLSLIKHGTEVFGTIDAFHRWLVSTNPLFDGNRPTAFLDTINGIKFVDDRVTAMEYGDNI